MSISRRTFLGSTTLASLSAKALTATVDAKTGMPMRVLGRTGANVSLLAFGAGSRWLMYKEEKQAAEALYKALDAGVNYVDTAYSYGNGESERRLGLFLGGRRKNIWLTTKLQMRGYDEIRREFEGCLRRLQTDHVDLLHMHDFRGEDDLAAIMAPDGALKALYKLRDEKTARHIGVTCHTDPEMLAKLLNRADLDCTQMALNAALMGNAAPSNVRGYAKSFESVALPVALQKNMGVTAMKVLAQEKLLPDGRPEELLRYAMSLPVAAAVVGMPRLEHIEANVSTAKAFRPMTRSEMKSLSGRLAAAKKASIDHFFAGHADACDECGAQIS